MASDHIFVADSPMGVVRAWNRPACGEAESSAAIAAVLWFVSASFRLKKRKNVRRGLESGIDDPKAMLVLIYQQSRWSAWAAIAAGVAALLAMVDGLFPAS